MFYQFLYSLAEQHSIFNVFRYITVRAFIAFFTSFFLCLLWGPYFIRRMQERMMGQSIRDDGPQSHLKKAGTPTMGGGLILLSSLVPCLLWVDMFSPLVWAVLTITWGFGVIGYLDDWMKVSKRNHRGLSGKVRLAGEFLISGVTIALLVYFQKISTQLPIPFFKHWILELGYF